MASKAPILWSLVFRKESDQRTERFRSGCDEFCKGAERLKVMVSRKSLELDLLVTQYDDLLISERAAKIFREQEFSGLEVADDVDIYLRGERQRRKFFLFLPRGFGGLVHPSSGVRISKFAHEQFTFVLPSDPRWKSDPVHYLTAGDVFRIWPFHSQVFVSSRFRSITQESKLLGFEFLPFEAREPKRDSDFDSFFFKRLNVGPPPRWLSDKQRKELWNQMLSRAEPGVMPLRPPHDWQLKPIVARSLETVLRHRAAKAVTPLKWVRRSLVPKLPRAAKVEAIEYLRMELASPGCEEWTARDLVWDGDAEAGRTRWRRWRLTVYPEPIWVVLKTSGGRTALSISQ
jgi:hypothetical protein